VHWCIANNVLKGFFEKNGSEVINMLFDEWKLEDALVVEREEGREEGQNMVLELMEGGYTPEEIRAKLAAFQTGVQNLAGR
jgi:hypothetical protein